MPVTIRPVARGDFDQWLPLWLGYNAFYGREGETALDPAITQMTWSRFFDAYEPVFGLVAEENGKLLGMTNYLYHRSTTLLGPICSLQDLSTPPAARGMGVGRALIEGVHARAAEAGCARVYWQTQTTNAAGRMLYDKVAQHLGFIVYTKPI